MRWHLVLATACWGRDWFDGRLLCWMDVVSQKNFREDGWFLGGVSKVW